MIRVRPAIERDAAAWLELRRSLWPENGGDYHAQEVARFFGGQVKIPLAVLVAETDESTTVAIVGFAELNIRPYAEGCASDQVGFLEGWFVVPEARRRGVGRALIQAAENWARAHGCTEFASDTLADNDIGAAAHRALGFEEVEVIRCFRKDLAR